MKKLLCAAIILFCSSSFAANWFANACNAGNISTCDWRPTVSTSCVGTGTALVWANRVAGDHFYANGCASITVDVNPGVGGSPVTLENDTSNGANAGGTFALSSALTVTAHVTAGSASTAALTLTGTAAITLGCATPCIFQGGTAASAVAVLDTHTTSTVTVTGVAKGGTNGSATGYNFTAASGTVDGTALNCVGGSNGFGCVLGNTAGATMILKNCISSDIASAATGCNSSNGSASPLITLKGSAVSGKYTGMGAVKFVFSPTDLTSAIYYGLNSTYTSTDIVDATTFNVKALGSQTTTNVAIFPIACAAGSGCANAAGIGNQANVVNAIVYGPYTGTTASSGQNSGSAN